jgi:acyl-CoA thioesterase
MGDLETALKLSAGGDSQWQGRADPAYEANTGMYGGMTAALLLKAVMSEGNVQGTPSALTVNFVRAVTPGSEIAIRTRLLGASRSIQNWTAELSHVGSSDIHTAASLVTTTRRESDRFVQPKMPEVPAPEGLESFSPPGTFGQQSPVRVALGQAFDTGSHLGQSHSAAWIREVSGRKIDAVQIAYLCDNYAPRAFYIGKGPRPSSTVVYSIYFLATADELAKVGDDYTLLEAIGTQASQGTVGSRVNLWSRAGVLLATSEQLCWFR